MVTPVSGYFLAVNEDTVSVISFQTDLQYSILIGFVASIPTDREMIDGKAFFGSIITPVKIHPWIYTPYCGSVFKLLILEVFGFITSLGESGIGK
ncbi:hypothetical protein SDC9_137729 [bioreactor metagenome]|uniref:Uncharacterized protein n=1 Tax=bioreactor metagenome TaxID=1076179 RepID=A0A645DNC8_9ZZZZ